MEKPELLDYPAAAAYLGLSPMTLRRYVSKQRIGYTKLGPRAVRFTPAQLQAFIRAGAVEPKVE